MANRRSKNVSYQLRECLRLIRLACSRRGRRGMRKGRRRRRMRRKGRRRRKGRVACSGKERRRWKTFYFLWNWILW